MEIHSHVNSHLPNPLQAFDRVIQTRRTVQPSQISRTVHFDGAQTLRLARRGRGDNIRWAIPADPRVDVDAVAHFPPQ